MCHALVIEDEPLVAMMIEDVLREGGAHSVCLVATEAEAILEAAARRPDFITADVRLAEGTGPGAVEVIRRSDHDIPVLFLTATPQACPAFDQPGAILTKPASAKAIAALFQELTKARC